MTSFVRSYCTVYYYMFRRLSSSTIFTDAAADMSSGPEDLLLEELVRKWKWAAAQRSNRQRQPQLANYGFGEEDEEMEPEEPIRFEPKMSSEHQPGHRNFAYRPHDAGFIQRGPAERQMEAVNPLIQSGMLANKLEAILCTVRTPVWVTKYEYALSSTTFSLLLFNPTSDTSFYLYSSGCSNPSEQCQRYPHCWAEGRHLRRRVNDSGTWTAIPGNPCREIRQKPCFFLPGRSGRHFWSSFRWSSRSRHRQSGENGASPRLLCRHLSYR